jgi:serine/threonine protein kinase
MPLAPMRSQAAAVPQIESFGKYQLLGLMNSGGIADLQLALQQGARGFSKVVALKRVLPHLAESAEFSELFLDEARLAARLDHPNIVRIYDLGEEGHRYYMAMEYLPGEDLHQVQVHARRAGKSIPLPIVATLIADAAAGLHFAHELKDRNGSSLGCVHRDVNPSNIIVTYQGAVKIVDFGIAHAADHLSDARTGAVMGKPAYVSPEVIYGGAADRRSDLFGLGVIFWELLTGEKLFSRNTDAATLHAVTSDPVLPPSAVRSDVPAVLDSTAMRALAKKPSDTGLPVRKSCTAPWRRTSTKSADLLLTRSRAGCGGSSAVNALKRSSPLPKGETSKAICIGWCRVRPRVDDRRGQSRLRRGVEKRRPSLFKCRLWCHQRSHRWCRLSPRRRLRR